MNYAQIVGTTGTPGSLAAWLNDSRIPNDVPEIVIEAESWIYRRLRHWKMLTPPTPGTMTVGQDFITNPADMLEPFLLVLTGQYQQNITQRTPQEVVMNWSYDGQGNRVQQTPQMFWFDQAAMRFDSPPNLAYNYMLMYFQQPAPLATTQTNFITATYPRLMRCALMAAGCEWMKDSGQGTFDRTYWDQLAQDEIEKAQMESDRAKRGTVSGAVLIGGGMATNYPAYTNGY